MKVIQENKTQFKIYGEELTVINNLPAGIYTIEMNPMGGPFLLKHPDIADNDMKIYGDHNYKVDKVVNSFKNNDRMGVILSGEKGLGKSLMANGIAKKAVEELNMPVIIVPGPLSILEDYTNRIEQPVMLLFDEFEKKYDKQEQNELLTFFDGGTNNLYKRLFVITCNNYGDLSQYFVNRPGRFYYHFQFNSPTMEEICQYLDDNLDITKEASKDQIATFAMATQLNFDCLKAIISEINAGYEFKETIRDLNITKSQLPTYEIEVLFESGVKVESSITLDVFVPKIAFYANLTYLDHKNVNPFISEDEIYFEFLTKNLCIDYKNNKASIDPSDLILLRDRSLAEAKCKTEEQIAWFDEAYDKIAKVSIVKRVYTKNDSFYA